MFEDVNKPQTIFKVIKLLKVQSDNSIKDILKEIQQALDTFTDWSFKEKTSIQEYFLQFPNQSIYNEGIRISIRRNEGKILWFKHQLITKILNIDDDNCIAYQFQPSLVFSNPVPILKSIGFQQATRKHSNVTLFNSLKVGLQILVYHQKQEQSPQQFKKTIIEIVETLSRPPQFNQELLWAQVLKLLNFCDAVSEVQKNEINHELMTIKRQLKIQTAL